MENDASAQFSTSALTQRFAANFSSLYRSIFPPQSPHSSSTVISYSASSGDRHSTTARSAIAMEHRARLVLEYQQLHDPYDLRRAYDLTEEIDLLAQLRLANSELAMQSCFRRLGLSYANFSALYRFIFPPQSPHSSSTVISYSASSDDRHSTTARSAIAMEHRARLVLEYQQLHDPYDLRRAYDLTEEIDLLAQLRLANSELAMQSCFRRLGLSYANSMGSDFSSEGVCNYRPTSVVEQSGYETSNPARVWLPKMRSSGYLRLNQAAASYIRSSRPVSRLRMPRAQEPTKVQQREYLPGGKTEQEALEFEVHSQGMFKMELCNKWQETGTPPYGDHYQFARGIGHPHDETEVFRMALAGDTCPYSHRYHFHNSLAEQEMMLAQR